MPVEQTYLMIKPDGIQRQIVGKIISRFEERGYRLAAMKLTVATPQILEQHYAEHIGKPFLPGLIKKMTGPVICMVFEGVDVITQARKIMGATRPSEAAPGTIRGDYCQEAGRNIIHGSDSVESAKREISLWFKQEEIHSYNLTLSNFILE
ncbi:nucleoside diphosphate kinase, putative [Cryptosporidium muris RN66]|uniref:Nucleoside diphosphate kinase n=1 Tax=Cryptosporidium muris (strain RN66) TaxID=441375 RepID=B6ACQ5_CRYMR|nr:nucleoside diphosphate kinase, putative [Cryptosporidium muris RN66]EEA05909.1 nucleoside diphosphate kinase, putative [Cryptosporidium muris RN66]|eukprot:XP_002140258.1 nucleoside diphosphate kinase [Cryptosporidium muris RN66]